MNSHVVSKICETIAEWRCVNTGCCTVFLVGFVKKSSTIITQESLEALRNLCADIAHEVLVCDEYFSDKHRKIIGRDRSVSWHDGLQRAHIVVYLCKNSSAHRMDKKTIKGKKVLNFYRLDGAAKQSNETQAMFWPASSVLDFFIVNQTAEQCTQPQKIGSEEKIQ